MSFLEIDIRNLSIEYEDSRFHGNDGGGCRLTKLFVIPAQAGI
jgi:hypothetical protein